MAGGSRKVIILALVANASIGVAKLFAAGVTRSGAMLAEAIHSFADTGNQALLLLGGARAKRPPNERHPLGYGREAYFWAMLVAVMLFTMGGGFSLYEGLHKLSHPEPLTGVGWAIGVLLFACALEGASLRLAWIECKKARGEKGLLAWARETGDVDLLVVTFEDLAAMAGLVVALAAVGTTSLTGDPRFDALGTIVVGVLLLLVAVFVAAQVRRLIVGFAVERSCQDNIRAIWDEAGFDVLNLIAVWSGPRRILLACKVSCREKGLPARELLERLNATEKKVRAAHPEVGFQFVEPDYED